MKIIVFYCDASALHNRYAVTASNGELLERGLIVPKKEHTRYKATRNRQDCTYFSARQHHAELIGIQQSFILAENVRLLLDEDEITLELRTDQEPLSTSNKYQEKLVLERWPKIILKAVFCRSEHNLADPYTKNPLYKPKKYGTYFPKVYNESRNWDQWRLSDNDLLLEINNANAQAHSKFGLSRKKKKKPFKRINGPTSPYEGKDFNFIIKYPKK